MGLLREMFSHSIELPGGGYVDVFLTDDRLAEIERIEAIKDLEETAPDGEGGVDLCPGSKTCPLAPKRGVGG